MRVALNHLLLEVRRQETVLGAFLAGSYARGAPMATSDVEVFVVVPGLWRQRQIRYREGYEFEIFFNPVAQLERELAEGQTEANASTVSILHDAEIIDDATGVIARLKMRAEAIWTAGPPACPPLTVQLLRYAVSDGVKDVFDLLDAGRREAAQVLAGNLMVTILEAYFRLHRLWAPKPKDQVEVFLARRPDLGDEVRRALRADLASLEALADHVLAPAGGRIQGDWTLPKEPLG